MSILRDTTLRRLAKERLQLMRRIAPVLTRAGPHHPYRSLENKRRKALRKVLRDKIRRNEAQIVAHVMLLMQFISPEE